MLQTRYTLLACHHTTLIGKNDYSVALFVKLLKLGRHFREEQIPVVGMLGKCLTRLCLNECPVHIEARHLHFTARWPISKTHFKQTI